MTATRRLAAILAADVAGYSRLIGADEGGTLRRLRAIRDELVDPTIAAHHGRLVKTTGDGLLVEFGSVVDALRSASEIQASVAERNGAEPQDDRIEFRMGLNVGDVVVEDGDIFGDGVNVAARLEGLAEPGGICVSARVQEDAAGKLDLVFEDMGEQQLKNISRPVRVYALRPEAVADLPARSVQFAASRRRSAVPIAMAVAAAAVLVIAGIGWWLWPATRSSPTAMMAGVPAAMSIVQPFIAPRMSIVVLPFANLNNDPEQQYFADAVTEDLTTDLSRLSDMFVISRNTAFTYKDKPVDAKQIGRELGVRYILEGSVRRSGNQLRINAQLIDAETGAHLWAERFDRDTGDLFAVQNEITSRIAVALNLKLIAAEAARPTENPDALDYMLRARATGLQAWTRDAYAEGISQLERALTLDPRSVAAQSSLAAMLAGRAMDNMTESAAADVARADELSRQALAASSRSPFAHYARAQVLRAQGRCEEAIPEYETAITFDRNRVNAISQLGWCKFLTGSPEEAIRLVEQAIRLSPLDPFIATWYSRIGVMRLLQSRTDEAIVWFERARSSNPGHPARHAQLASAYGLKGDLDRAAAELVEAQRLSSDDRYSSIARLEAAGYAGSGYWGVPKVRALFEATYFAGLRKAGMPDE